jgi:hypothetical protein
MSQKSRARRRLLAHQRRPDLKCIEHIQKPLRESRHPSFASQLERDLHHPLQCNVLNRRGQPLTFKRHLPRDQTQRLESNVIVRHLQD